ncbi:DUF6541 family protein [Falsarthrobacter nasiphocae]|uniref:Uncharacterized protein n=1 Tax=Falsarthrobacter nasiphocae TaxID=189863 RepID=A0AAE4C6C0_9MICC|nr:DUF6541 family protein [Falsarthrobacter nasiphocae]MDR6891997.1 hypothetical protein [Falsarthrobacter nasiphocae]
MRWSETLPFAAIAVAFIMVPGWCVLRALGARGLAALAGAGPVTVTIAGTSAVAAGALHVPWDWRAALATAGLTVAAAAAVRRLGGRLAPAAPSSPTPPAHAADLSPASMAGPAPAPHSSRLTAAVCGAALAFAGAVVSLRYALAFGNVEHVSQSYDNVYHLNAVRAIVRGQNGSSLTLGNLTPESQGFYPAAWHDLVALLFSASGLSIPATVTLVNIVTAAVIWPLGLLFLVTRVTGPRLLPMAITGAVAPAFPAFPYHMVDMGVLYPTHMAIAILPAALGFAIEALRLSAAPSPRLAAAALALVLPGLFLAHPSMLLALVAFVLPLVAARLYRLTLDRRSSPEAARAHRRFVLAALAYLASGAAAWVVLRPPASAATWRPVTSPSRALGEVLGGTPVGMPGGIPMMVLTVAGLVAIVRARRLTWVACLMGVSGALYIVCIAFAPTPLRLFVTGNWYNDWNRLAALLPMASAPVVVLGAEALMRSALAWAGAVRPVRALHGWAAGTRASRSTTAAAARRALGGRTVAASAVLAVAVAGLGLKLQTGSMRVKQEQVASRYSFVEGALLLSPDERALLERLPRHVREDQAIVANPRNGESLALALADRRVLKPHVHGAVSDDVQYLLDRWREAATDPLVCSAVRATGAYFALDFGGPYVSEVNQVLPGTEGLDRAAGVELVDAQGRARLFRVTVCGETGPQGR